MKLKIKLFYFNYVLLFLSLFIQDLALDSIYINDISKFLKIMVVLLTIIQIYFDVIEKKKLSKTLLFGLPFLVIFFATNDLFWIIVFLLAFSVKELDKRKIMKVSFNCLVILILITLMLCFTGVLPDITNTRYLDDNIRHSFGFYHSNVLPIAFFYLMVYYITSSEKKMNPFLYTLFLAITILLYYFCDSKNGLFSSIALLIAYVIVLKLENTKVKDNKLIDFASRNIMIICLIISFIPTIFRARTMFVEIWNYYDKIFTNRIYLSARQFNLVGVHFVNFMNSTEYFQNAFIVDNAYVYTTLRYGVIASFIFVLCNRFFIKAFNNSLMIKILFIIIAIFNIIDNDLFSYGFLPFMIIAIYEMINSKKEETHNNE